MQKHRKLMTSNTVLVSINGTLGSVAFYNNEKVVLGKSACYFNLSSLVDKHFVRRVIESPYFVNYAIDNATGTTIRNLGLKAMNYFPVPLPPIAEQRWIVTKVDQLMALVDELEAQLAVSRVTGEKLIEAIVAELTA
jgi:type I restriction enzyme S subunit